MVGAAPRERRLDPGAAVARAASQLTTQPLAAKALALQILQTAPGHPQARLILGSALRRLGDASAARQVLDPLARDRPDWSVAHYELGLALSVLGEAGPARCAFLKATAMAPSPDMAPAWRALGDPMMAEATEALARRDFASPEPCWTRGWTLSLQMSRPCGCWPNWRRCKGVTSRPRRF